MLCLLPLLLLSLTLSHRVWANTEKVIFIAPRQLRSPDIGGDLSSLKLQVLTPSSSSSTFRTHVPVEFPKAEGEHGLQYWLLLDNLVPGTRYEFRVCWAAVEPSAFKLYNHELKHVFDTPDLIQGLANFTSTTQLQSPNPSASPAPPQHEEGKSLVFVQVFAAADYYTADHRLMSSPLPVYVDFILDPYYFNILPRSLAPTIAYVVTLFILSFYASDVAWKWIRGIVQAQRLHRE